MYIRLLLFVVLTISWLAHGSSSYVVADDDFDSTSNNLLLDELTTSCPSDGIPVCGIRNYEQYVIFPNECLLDEVNKNVFLGMTYIKKIPLKQCIYRCQLNCPKIYKPICAQNLRTLEKKIYFNLCEITKYSCQTNTDFVQLNLKECKSRITFSHSNKLIEKRSKTIKRRPIPCRNIFKPVCASYLGVKSTFKNECLLNAENIKYHRDWHIVKKGICDEDYANVKEVKEKPTKPHSIKKRSYLHKNFVDFSNSNKYDTNNFVDYKSESNAPHNNGVYVYMPTPFQTQFLDHSYQQPMKVANAYNDILKSIISMPTEEEETIPHHKNVAYRDTPSKPMPFSTGNEMNFNYMPNEISRNDHITAAQPSTINNVLNRNNNKDYFYTFEKVQPNGETLNRAYDKPRSEIEQRTFENNEPSSEIEQRTFENNEPSAVIKPRSEIEQRTFENNEPSSEIEQRNFEKMETNQETEQFTEKTTTFSTPKETTEITTTEISTTPTMNQSEIVKKFNILKKDENQECKFGSLPICGVLPDGDVKTFKSVCEMMTTNIYLKNTWTKLHEGECGNCKYNCTRDYQPICVTRNGVNYTIVNDCYYNMGICMDKKSVWKKIANGECERYTRIPDKYENSKPGFPFTSSNFETSNSTTMAHTMTSSTPLPTTQVSDSTADIIADGNKPLRLKFRKANVRKLSSKRVVNRRSSAPKTSSNGNVISKKDVIVTTDRPTTRLSLYGPHTNSYIMRLVNERVNRKLLQTT